MQGNPTSNPALFGGQATDPRAVAGPRAYVRDAIRIAQAYREQHPSRELSLAITHLEEAAHWLDHLPPVTP